MVRIQDKMQVIQKEITHDGAKSGGVKWNFIGGVQFKHVKNYPMFMCCCDWVCSDWTWDVFFMVYDGM